MGQCDFNVSVRDDMKSNIKTEQPSSVAFMLIYFVFWFTFLTNSVFLSRKGIFGFVFLPPGWTSFENKTPERYEYIQSVVGNYGYLALGLMLLMQFGARFGIFGLPQTYLGEVFPLK